MCPESLSQVVLFENTSALPKTYQNTSLNPSTHIQHSPKMHAIAPLFAFIISVPLILPQNIFINLVPEYIALPSCAQSPLSSIVRDMQKGCGDGGATTSYSCFCTASSSYFSALISTVVVAQCSESGQASSAVDVFESYCAVGTVTSQAHPTTIAIATGN